MNWLIAQGAVPDIGGAVAEGRMGRMQDQQMSARNALVTALQSGDQPGARAAYNAFDPVGAYQAQQPDPEAQRKAALGLVQGVKAVPEELRPQAWAAAIQQAGALGLQVDGVPGEYPGPQYLDMLGGILGMSAGERTEFERMLATLPPEQAQQALLVRLGLAPDANATARAGSPLVTVNTGTPADTRPLAGQPPAGYQRRFDAASGSWMDEPIPGSKPAREDSAEDRQLRLAATSYETKFRTTDKALGEAIDAIGQKGRLVAGFGSLLSPVPESAAKDFQAMLDTIKANLGFEELQTMRDNSPTGGALGQVTERELAFLQAAQGNLDASQSPKQLLKVLTEIRERRREFAAERKRIMESERAPSPTTTGVEAMSNDEIKALLGLQ